jgi:hypothetical protein
MDIEQLRFPIGHFKGPEHLEKAPLSTWLAIIKNFPDLIQQETNGLTFNELAFHYRPKGWNIKQVVHHCADSHMNALIRFKLALTEDNPTIKPYQEAAFAELADSTITTIHSSIQILYGVHQRLSELLASLDDTQWKRTFIHPEHPNAIYLWENAGRYAWHCEHHLAHIKQAKQLQFPH